MTLDTTVLLLLLMLLALPFSKPLLLILLITLMLSRFRILLLLLLLLLVTGMTVKGCALVPELMLLLLLGKLRPSPLSIRETGLVVLGLMVVVSQADRGIVGSPEFGDVVRALGDVVVVLAVTRS